MTTADESYPLRCEIAYQKEIVQRMENRLGRLWPLAQAAEALAVLTEAHTGIADNSPEGIIRAIKAMRETIKSLNRRAQYAESKHRLHDLPHWEAALKFYADPQTYGMHGGSMTRIFADVGQRARDVLWQTKKLNAHSPQP